nr:cellulose binding domain-containing protein [Chengkuizengella sediminis]
MVNLSWSDSSYADSYSVGRSTSSSGGYTTIATGLTTTAYNDTGLTNGTTYYYIVTAENGSGTTDSNTVSATPQLPSDIQLQYKAADTNAADNQFKPHFNMVNTGNSAIPLSELTIRYYYTADGSQSFEFHCDYAVLGCGNISGTHVQMSNPVEDADHYLEISFAAGAGSLSAGGQSGEIQARSNKVDWSNLNEINDYSFNGNLTDFTEWNQVTLYQNGVLISGIEPDGSGGGDPTPPAAPVGVTASAGDGEVGLSWNGVSGADSYNVKRSISAGGTYATIAAGVTSTNYTDTNVTNETTYYYVISAENAVGESGNSIEVSATPQSGVTIPGNPTGLTASAGDGEVNLSWNVESEADGYNVKRSTSAGGTYATIAAGVTSTSYTDTSVTNDTTYYYVVSAENQAGESGNSAEVSATPQSDGGGTPSELVLQYKASDTNTSDNQFKPHFNIVNNGSSDISLSDLTIRYYYTLEGDQSEQFNCDYATVGCANVNGTNIQMTQGTAEADHYVEVTFTAGAGSISAGGQSGEIQTRNNKLDWSNYDETNDYSFDGSIASFMDWDRVTLYHNGQLVWGIEP